MAGQAMAGQAMAGARLQCVPQLAQAIAALEGAGSPVHALPPPPPPPP
eukprot:SAG11_NODE_24288_length_375_cov_1.402174_1_plen_47_part_10